MAAGDTRDIAIVVDEEAVSAVIGGVVVNVTADSAIAGPGRAGATWAGANNTATTGYALEYIRRRAQKWSFGIEEVAGAHQILQGAFQQTTPAWNSDYAGLTTANAPGKGGHGSGNAAVLPFVSGTNRTFTGSAIITGTGGVPVFWAGTGIAGDATPQLPVLEAVIEGADGYASRVHYNSNVQAMGVFGSSIFARVLPPFRWFHYAFRVADNGTTQAVELFINGVSRGSGTTTQVTWHANSGPYATGTRGEGSALAAGGHAMDGTHGPQHVYPRLLSNSEIQGLSDATGFKPDIIANYNVVPSATSGPGTSTRATTTAVGQRGGAAVTSTGARTVAAGGKNQVGTAVTTTGARTVASGFATVAPSASGAAATSTGASTVAVGFEGAKQSALTSTGARTVAAGQKGSANASITSTGARTTAVGFEGAKQFATTSTGAQTTAQGGAIHGGAASTSTGARTVAVGQKGGRQAALTTTGARTVAVGFEGAKQNALTSTGGRSVAVGRKGGFSTAQTTAGTRTVAVGYEGAKQNAQTTSGARTVAGGFKAARQAAQTTAVATTIASGFAGVPIPPPDDPHTFFILDPGDSPLTLAAHDGQTTITDEPVDASVDDEPVEAGVDEPETEVEVADPNGTLSVDG